MAAKPALLVVDDDASVWVAVSELLSDGCLIRSALDAASAFEILRSEHVDAILLDLTLPDMDGFAFFRLLRDRITLPPPVIILTATQTAQAARRAFQMGAYDYIAKPWDCDDLRQTVARAVERRGLQRRKESLEAERPARRRFDDILTRSPAVLQVLAEARRLAERDVRTVLITGEPGTGKDLLAQAIHAHGPRRDGPFIPINSASIPVGLAESVLFGHEKGAFTGADRPHRGLFEVADGGTLFLDDIDGLTPDVQAKLLRVVEDGRVFHLGGEAALRVDVRVIVATNADLESKAAEGAFRKDLLQRLNVFRIHGVIPAESDTKAG